MKTDKLQRLEDRKDLKLLKKGDVIDVESFGNMAYFGNKDNKMIFIGRDNGSALVNLSINPESNHKVEKGKIMFKSATYSTITQGEHYNMQNEFLRGLKI